MFCSNRGPRVGCVMAKISTSIVSLARCCRQSAAICLLASSLGGSPHETVAQGLPIDRWLITGVDSVPSTNPLGESMQWGFPDRNLTVGPGLWTLVREDGRSRFDFSDYIGPGKAALAHVYLKALTDLTVHMFVKTLLTACSPCFVSQLIHSFVCN